MNPIRTATRLDEVSIFALALRHLGGALSTIRHLAGLSQAELSEAIRKLTHSNIDQSTISRIEKGGRYFNYCELYAACRVLNCSPDHLFEHALQIARNEHAIEEGDSSERLLEEIIAEEQPPLVAREAFHRESEKIYPHLRRNILLGNIPNGEIIPAEAIAEEFGGSVEDVTRAFRLLQDDGCALILGKTSCMVPEYSIRHMISVVCRRIEIEATAARVVASDPEKRSKLLKDLRRIQEKMMELESQLRLDCGESVQTSTTGEFIECDIDFHLAIVEHAGHNENQVELMRLILQVLVGTQTMAIRSRPQEVIDEHSDVIASLESGEGIVSALREHMIGNARQWESILRDRFERSGEGNTSTQRAERFEEFKKVVTERTKELTSALE